MSFNSPISITIIIFCLAFYCKADTVQTAHDAVSDTKIYGGTFAKQEDTLHQVSIRIISKESTKGFGGGHNCGGSLITSQLVLTAAHCMYASEVILDPPYIVFREYNKDELVIVMGTLDRTNQTENTIVRATADWVIYPSYDRHDVMNDVAIIKLNATVPNNIPTIKPITTLGSAELKSGTNCLVSGWGAIENKTSPALLLSVTVPIVDPIRCNASDSYNGTINDGMICAGNMQNGLVDSCQGDSGGPLVCDKVLSGIVSFGHGCGLPYYPGVYVKVAHFRDWIKTESNNLMGIIDDDDGNSTNGNNTNGNGTSRTISGSFWSLFSTFVVFSLTVILM